MNGEPELFRLGAPPAGPGASSCNPPSMAPSWSSSGAPPHPCPTATCVARLDATMALPPPLTWPGSTTSGDGEASGRRIRQRRGPDPWRGRRRRSRTGTDGGGRSTFLLLDGCGLHFTLKMAGTPRALFQSCATLAAFSCIMEGLNKQQAAMSHTLGGNALSFAHEKVSVSEVEALYELFKSIIGTLIDDGLINKVVGAKVF